MKNLIIVESPAKARTIKNFLGKDYNVIASKGHIRDLPKSQFGIKIDEDEKTLTPKYIVAKENNKTVKEIKDLAKTADIIYIATDEDREGEAIGWHIAHAIKKHPENLPRIVFHEITKKAIIHSLENPRKIDMSLVNAQQSRRLLDRIVGYKLSPLLASKIQRGLSAGRVQSSSLKIIIDKEREIKAFVPVEYWTINTLFNGDIEANLQKYKDLKIDKLTISDETLANEIKNTLLNEVFIVSDIQTKKRISKTPPPFMTSTLQQAASSQLGFTPKRTMIIAQALYEGIKIGKQATGLITYMRTDSLNLASEAVESARAYIAQNFGDQFLPETLKVYSSKAKGAQEAHEAIRPVNIDLTPQEAEQYLKPEELKLYTLIYKRFIACQMQDAEFQQQSLLINSKSSLYKINGRKLIFAGFYKILGTSDKDKLLPNLKIDEVVKLSHIKPEQHFTEPPARYSEATLIKTLEAAGIGRPSTYAPTITTLQARKYIDIEKRSIIPTEISFIVMELLEKNFPEIVDATFTANMEEKLDEITKNTINWQKMLSDFYFDFMKKIAKGKENIVSLKVAIPTGESCPKCGEELLLRKGRFGEFIACGGFPKCKYTQNTDDDNQTKEVEESDVICDKCQSPMIIKLGRNGKFLACSAYPTCKNTKAINAPEPISLPCPNCGGTISLKKSKRGAFYGCDNYPECKFISKFEPIDKKCPECDNYMAQRTLKNKEIYECIDSKCKTRIDLE